MAFSMGLNESGQLGHSADAQFVPVGACILQMHASQCVSYTCCTHLPLLRLTPALQHLNGCAQVPQAIDTRDALKSVAAGHHHTLFLTGSGDVWSCGKNTRGQLGLGGKAPRLVTSPQRIEALVGE